MTDKAPTPTVGWTVTVRRLVLGGSGERSLEVFYAAIPDASLAVEAVTAIAGATADTEVVAHQSMSQSLKDALGLKPAQVKRFGEV